MLLGSVHFDSSPFSAHAKLAGVLIIPGRMIFASVLYKSRTVLQIALWSSLHPLCEVTVTLRSELNDSNLSRV